MCGAVIVIAFSKVQFVSQKVSSSTQYPYSEIPLGESKKMCLFVNLV